MTSETDAPGGEPSAPGRVGVVDIGSNSIRLVVYDRLGRAPLTLVNEKVLCGLGRSLGRTGALDGPGVALALTNLSRFRRVADGLGCSRLDILATAAVREAADGADFVTAVEQRMGQPVRILSGEDEARLSALGVMSGTPAADGLAGDLGGGSLELTLLNRGTLDAHGTLPLGAFRLLEATDAKPGAMARQVDEALASLPWLGQVAGRVFHPVGGGWRALARAHMAHVDHPLHIIHQYTVGTDDLIHFAALVARQSRTSLERLAGVSRRRLETLPAAALVMERVLRTVRPSRVVFSAYGLREGHLFSLLPGEEAGRDPLLAACTDLAGRLGRSPQAEALVQWVAPLFVGEDEGAARLRQAACLLSDLGWAEHPDYRAEHGCLRVLRLPVGGIDHAGRAFLAATLFVRYGGEDPPLPLAGALRLLPETAHRRAQVLGLALRLGHTLTGGAPAVLRQTVLRLEPDRLILSLPGPLLDLAGEVVHRRLDALARALGRSEVIVAGDAPP